MPVNKYGVIFVIWLTAIIVSASYFIGERLVEFDPVNRLVQSNKAELLALSKQFSSVSQYASHYVSSAVTMPTSPSSSTTTLYHISTPDCHCNDITRDHITKLNQKAEELGYTVKEIQLTAEDLEKLPLISATPAVMLIGDNNQFVYFGPYAQGLGCSETAGMVEVSMNNYHKGYNGEVIFSEAEGCYCQNKKL